MLGFKKILIQFLSFAEKDLQYKGKTNLSKREIGITRVKKDMKWMDNYKPR